MRNGGEIRGPILGFQIADNSYAILIEEYARRWQRENAVSDTCILFLYFKPVGEPMGPFTSAGSPWGRLSGETKMASLWAQLTPYCEIEISENKNLRG